MRVTRTLVSLLCLFFLAPAGALEVREIGWEDLVPMWNIDFENPFASLTEDQLVSLGAIVQIREFLQSDPSNMTEEITERVKTLKKELDQQGVDVDGLLARHDEIEERRRVQANSFWPPMSVRVSMFPRRRPTKWCMLKVTSVSRPKDCMILFG